MSFLWAHPVSMGLYPYQRIGADFLKGQRRAYLADQMGLGKSVQAITAAREVGAERPLVVCPASAVPNWEAEWDKWDGPGDPVFVSYASLVRSRAEYSRRDLVILDEAHYAKTPTAKRTRASLAVAARADRAFLLSGTPMPNDPTELWAPVSQLWPELVRTLDISTAREWMYKFCRVRMTDWGPKPYAVRNGALLRALLGKFMLRRTGDDVGLDLPPLRVDLHRLPAKGLDLGEYRDMEADENAYTSSLRRVLGIAKAPAIASQIIAELLDGAYGEIVVLYYHNAVRDILRERFKQAGLSVVGFGGDTPTAARWEAVQAFQAGEAQVFLAQQSAAGIAINLTAASEIVLVEPAWSPDENSQAIFRIRRIGQERPCRARIFAIAGTIDMSIMSTIRTKVAMQRDVDLRD